MVSTSKALIFASLVSLAACDFFNEFDPTGPHGGDPVVTVMTRNLYLGTNFNDILGAPTVEDIPLLVSEFFANVQATNYPERVKEIADEIATTRPHLIGLQEVALYRMQTPGDFLSGQFEPNATEVVLDFLALLQNELAVRKLPYRVVSESVNVDEELPGVGAAGLFDLRLTLRNVILARPNVRVTSSEEGVYEAKVELPIGPATVSFTRSYGWIDAVVSGVPFRFVNTHLETEGAAPIQVLQTGELLELLEDVDRPVILIGDFNSAADGSTTASYNAITSSGYTDAYSAANPGDEGFTCCQAADLKNTSSTLDRRIDLIFFRSNIDAISAQRVGEAPEDRTPSGLWPSDHAGVVADLRIDRRNPNRSGLTSDE